MAECGDAPLTTGKGLCKPHYEPLCAHHSLGLESESERPLYVTLAA